MKHLTTILLVGLLTTTLGTLPAHAALQPSRTILTHRTVVVPQKSVKHPSNKPMPHASKTAVSQREHHDALEKNRR